MRGTHFDRHVHLPYRGRRFRRSIPGALLAVGLVLHPATASALGQLRLFLAIETRSPESDFNYFPAEDVGSIEIRVSVSNLTDQAVEEGSVVLGNSLDVWIEDGSGTVVSAWTPDTVPTGQVRVWAPGERERLRLYWPFRTSELYESEDEADASLDPPALFSGYRVVASWQDLDGTVLQTESQWFEYLPGSRDRWPLRIPPGDLFAVVPRIVPTGAGLTLVALGGCGSLPSHATSRHVEVTDGPTIELHFRRYCGPFAAPSTFRLAATLPSVQLPPGRHPVELWFDGDGGDQHPVLLSTTTVTVTSQPVAVRSPSRD